MTREIKFRAWDKNKKEMFDVSPVWFEENNWYYMDFAKCMEELDCIIMQYTGLKDKNGKEIYDGDVVRTQIRNDKRYKNQFSEMLSKVCFENGIFIIKDLSDKLIQWNELYKEIYRLEIIGNIYQNPELLEKP